MLLSDSYIDEAMDYIVDENPSSMTLTNYKLFKKPKLRFYRLTEDKKIVPIVLDIPINDKLSIRERFDWNLNADFISPSEFAEEFSQSLGLSEKDKTIIRSQILTQIIDFVEKNTLLTRTRLRDEEKAFNFGDIERSNEKTNYFKENFMNEVKPTTTKLTARQLTLEKMKKSGETSGMKTFFSKKVCNFCFHKHLTPVSECKNCRMPFSILEELNIKDKTIKVSIKYYQICANAITLIPELNIHKELVPTDFCSVFILKNRLMELLKAEEETLESKEIIEKSLDMLNEIQIDFQKGKYDEEIKDENMIKKEGDEERIGLPIQKEIRKRGRPRKHFHPKKFFLKKTHHL